MERRRKAGALLAASALLVPSALLLVWTWMEAATGCAFMLGWPGQPSGPGHAASMSEASMSECVRGALQGEEAWLVVGGLLPLVPLAALAVAAVTLWSRPTSRFSALTRASWAGVGLAAVAFAAGALLAGVVAAAVDDPNAFATVEWVTGSLVGLGVLLLAASGLGAMPAFASVTSAPKGLRAAWLVLALGCFAGIIAAAATAASEAPRGWWFAASLAWPPVAGLVLWLRPQWTPYPPDVAAG